jgi:hypothetical protein
MSEHKDKKQKEERNRSKRRMASAVICVLLSLAMASVTTFMTLRTHAASIGRTASSWLDAVTSWIAGNVPHVILITLCCIAIVALIRVICEAVVLIADAAIGNGHRVTDALIAIAASAGAVALSAWTIMDGTHDTYASLAISVVLTLIIMRAISNYTTAFSLSLDATKYGMVPSEPYEAVPDELHPMGIVPTYRSIRRQIGRMQAVGMLPNDFLVISNQRELDDVVSVLPDGAPLKTFLTQTGPNVLDDTIRFPVAIGRFMDVNDNRFSTADAKKIARYSGSSVVSASEFCDTYGKYSWLVTQTFVQRDARIPKRRTRDAEAEARRKAMEKNHGTVVTMTDGSTAILLPDQSGVIPIDRSTVVPVVQQDDSVGLMHSDISKLVDVKHDKDAKPSGKKGKTQKKEETPKDDATAKEPVTVDDGDTDRHADTHASKQNGNADANTGQPKSTRRQYHHRH